jgi:hypothetical protein
MTMSITKDDASHALGEIDAAAGRATQFKTYARIAPFLMIWGAVWMVCDLLTQFAPQWGLVWPIGVCAGTLASIALGVLLLRQRATPAERANSWRHTVSWFLVIGFVVALFQVIPLTSSREVHSVFGLVFGFIYLGLGLWTGWRMAALGLALIALTLIGFYAIGQWYWLYMGLVGGGALFLGGLWLRRV